MTQSRVIITSVFFFCQILTVQLSHAAEYVYLSSGDHLRVYKIAEGEKARDPITEIQKLEVSRAGPIGISPDKKFLYLVGSQPTPEALARIKTARKTKKKKLKISDYSYVIVTCNLKDDGTVEKIKSARVTNRPGYLFVDKTGSYIFGNHYRPGNIGVWKLTDGIYKGNQETLVTVDDKAHSTLLPPSNKFLFVPTTGPNRVYQFTFDASTGKVSPNSTPYAEVPLNVAEDKKFTDQANHPRHLVFHPKLNVAYTTQEGKMPGVAVWDFDSEKGTLAFKESHITRLDYERYSTADLHLSPDARHLYVSNRAGPKSALAQYRVNEKDGTLTYVKHHPCEAVPRSFCLSPTGRFLFVAGQQSDLLGVYARDISTGELERVKQFEVGKGPIWVSSIHKNDLVK